MVYREKSHYKLKIFIFPVFYTLHFNFHNHQISDYLKEYLSNLSKVIGSHRSDIQIVRPHLVLPSGMLGGALYRCNPKSALSFQLSPFVGIFIHWKKSITGYFLFQVPFCVQCFYSQSHFPAYRRLCNYFKASHVRMNFGRACRWVGGLLWWVLGRCPAHSGCLGRKPSLQCLPV